MSANGNNANAAKRVGINAISLLAGDVLNRGVTFAIYALVARHGGALAFGQLSLGLMLLYAFQVLASVGLPTLIVRDVSKDPQSDAKYLVSASVIVSVAFVVCYALLALVVFVSGYTAETSQVILLLGLSILPWSLSLIAESIFRARERMHLILYAAVPVNVAKLGLAYYVLMQGGGVAAIALVLFTSHTAVLLVQWGILTKALNGTIAAPVWSHCRQVFTRSWNFFGIDALIAIGAAVNVVLLSWFSGEIAVGIFGAAVQLMIPPGIALQAIINSLFPVMCRRATEKDENASQLAKMIFEALMFVAIPGCFLLWFCAGPLITLVFDNATLLESALIVRIMIPSLVLAATTRILGQVLMSYQREGVNLRIVAVKVVFNVTCGAFLIYVYGVYGAAITLVLTSLVDCALHYITTRSLLSDDSSTQRAWGSMFLWHTLASALVMAAVLHVTGDAHFFSLVAIGGLTFIASFVALGCLFRCGTLEFRQRFLMPLAEE